MITKILTTLFLLSFSTPVLAQNTPSYCKKLDNTKTYKDNDSYRYLVIGKDEWVFRSRKDLKQDFTLTLETINLFSTLDKILKSQDKKIYIVMAPTRGILNADKIPMDSPWIENFDPQKAKGTFENSLNTLRNAGIFVADLSDIPANIRDNFYYKRDHHWTTTGAKYSAEKTALLIKPFIKNLPKQKFTTEEKPEKINIEGSFAQFIEKVCSTEIPDETTHTIQTYANDNDDLFEDAASTPIVLIGTSNTTEPAPSYSNFAGYVREYLQHDIENRSIQGAGIESPILSYFNAENKNKDNHKHLIWELASHYDFNGREFEPLFKQLIPAAAGACTGKEVVKSSYKIEGEKISLLAAEKGLVATKNHYVHLKFDIPTKKDLAISLKFDDEKSTRFRFKREDRYPHDGVYFLDLNGYGDKNIQEISLFLNKDIKAKNIDFDICAYPILNTNESKE